MVTSPPDPEPPPTVRGSLPPRSTTRPPGSPILSDAAAASHVRPARETQSENAPANHALPTKAALEDFHAALHAPYSTLVTGRFAGTTDEIIQWAAWKWGIDEDVMRAVAAAESGWNQQAVADGGVSFGLFSVKTQLASPPAGWPGSYPLARTSTAFNADLYGRAVRSCLDGRERWLGPTYHPGDLWGCVGAWFSGSFHDPPAESYVKDVKRSLIERSWQPAGARTPEGGVQL